MKIAAKVVGLDSLKKSLTRVDEAARAAMVAGLEDAAILVHEEAVKSIQARQSQGREYKRGRTTHYASLPGKPPNPDRGILVPGIKWQINAQKLYSLVGTDVPHGAMLEEGTKTVAARPWLLPALKKARGKISKLFLKTNVFRGALKK